MRLRWDRIMTLLAIISLLAITSVGGGAPGPTAKAAVRQDHVVLAAVCPQAREPTVVRAAPGAGRTVALTFDDGPGLWTPKVLDVLRRSGVKAAFFVIGRNAETNPGLVSAIAADGHLIGNHTWNHDPPPGGASWPRARLANELDRTDQLLNEITGSRTCWFRPPAGILSGATAEVRRRSLAVAMWSVDSRDWLIQKGARRDPDGELAHRIVVRATSGADQKNPIVLLHDGGGYRGATVAALPSIIRFYQSHGYTFVRLDGR